jgi:hypothetical protein
MPLNLLEAEGRWIVSTNSGWRNAYLQVYDEQKRTVVPRIAKVAPKVAPTWG